MKNIINKFLASSVIISILTYYASPVFAYFNEETIYSNLDSTGKEYNSTVTTIIEDEKDRKVNQEEVKKDLPIETKVTYFIDGKEVEADKIAGKKGRVTIKLEFENKDKNISKINGKDQEIYTPFVIVAGLMIDCNKNKNIEITNGKLITNGNTCIAVGMALPGMQESLDIDKEKIQLPSFIEISMDTERFESENIMIYSSPKLLSGINIKLSDFDEIFDKINALDTASKALENGANTLKDGIKTLDAGAVKLDNGINALDSGIDSLKYGSSELNDGATSLRNGTEEFAIGSETFNAGVIQISDGVSTLNEKYSELDNGINTLNEKSSELKNGAIALKDGVGVLDNGVTSLKDGAISINDGVSSLKDGAGKLDNGAEAVLNGINTVVDNLAPNMTEDIKNAKKTALDEIIGYNENVLGEDVNLTIEDLKSKIASYSDSLSKIPSNEELQSMLSAELISKEQYSNYEQTRELLSGLIQSLNTNIQLLTLTQGNYTALTQTKSSIAKTIDDTEDLYNGLLEIQKGMQSVYSGVNSISGGLTELSFGTNSLTSGLSELSTGSSNLLAGASQLSDGTIALESGTSDLANGSNLVVTGLASLNEGTNSLAENSEKLAYASNSIANGAYNLQVGTQKLQDGIGTLSDGSKELRNGSLSLTEGTLALVTGSETLASGIKQFNEDGISKIIDFANNKGKDLIRRFEKLEELSEQYTSFASKEKRDELKFISITDSVKVDEKIISSKNNKKSKK